MPYQMAGSSDRYYVFTPNVGKSRIPREVTTLQQMIEFATNLGATVITKQTGPMSRSTETVEFRLPYDAKE